MNEEMINKGIEILQNATKDNGIHSKQFIIGENELIATLNALHKAIDLEKELNQEKEKNKKLEEEKKQAFKDYNSTACELMDVINLMAEKLRDLKDDIDTLHEGEIDCFIPKDFCDVNGCAKYKDCAYCIKEYYFNKVREKKDATKNIG